MDNSLNIAALDFWPIRIPLAQSYHLSKVFGTLTHSQAVIVRLTLENGKVGWGECDPHKDFDGYSLEMACEEITARKQSMIGQSVADWVAKNRGTEHQGAPAAAIDVACFDALGKALGLPVWKLLGDRVHDGIDVLWPTSSGDAPEDLAIIREYHAKGFRTYMLKMGSNPIQAEIERTREVIKALPPGVQIMVDANQGWSREEASDYVRGCRGLPVVLVEQPLRSDDIDGLTALRNQTELPISVDESLLSLDHAREILAKDAADVFSIKISKSGGLANSQKIADLARAAGKKILMNSMIELGITQAASLHLGVTLDCLVPCGHAYMSTLRMADDVTDFSDWVKEGRATPSDRPGLGIEVSMDKIKQYEVGK